MASTVPVRDKDDLSLAYTPGVARVCLAIAADPALVARYTWTSKVVAIVTDGTAVPGLGDIGPAAAMPVMEGKAVLFKEFATMAPDAIVFALGNPDPEVHPEVARRYARVVATGRSNFLNQINNVVALPASSEVRSLRVPLPSRRT